MQMRSVNGVFKFDAWVCFIFVCVAFYVSSCSGHGRLIEPPSRASAWRYGFQTPPDYNDHELYCGGFQRQWKRNGGKCGECGDPWDMPIPRPHENGGQWGQGVVVRSYLPASEMTIRVELTASHMGYFEFRLCPEPSAKQECLDRNLLTIMSGSPSQPSPTDINTRFYPRNGSRIYDIKAILPDMKCNQCVLQWRYVAGNNWGMCDDGVGAVGCGPQEEFRSCSDIALTDDLHTPIRPIRPTYRTTLRPHLSSTSTESTYTEAESQPYNFGPVLTVAIILLVIALCTLVVWYFYRYKKTNLQNWLDAVKYRFCKKPKPNNPLSIPPIKQTVTNWPVVEKDTSVDSLAATTPPIRPPRTRRQSRIKELSANESSVA